MSGAITTRENDRAVIEPQSDVVAGCVGELRTAMRGMLADGVRQVVVDLGRVGMIDSSGIGLLISAHNSLSKLGGNLAVIHASKDILELFRAMRIHQHFSVSGE
jgi:anti-anti-sigma factor